MSAHRNIKVFQTATGAGGNAALAAVEAGATAGQGAAVDAEHKRCADDPFPIIKGGQPWYVTTTGQWVTNPTSKPPPPKIRDLA